MIVGSSACARLAWLRQSGDVVVLHWPGEADQAGQLDAIGVPHLLLVDAGADPPASGSCLRDWVWADAPDTEVETRLVTLAGRAACHPSRPTLDDFGQLAYRDASLFLSPLDQRLARALIDRFGELVGEHDLLAAAWPAGASEGALRVHVSRLRRRLMPFGLSITCVRAAGYVMRAASRGAE